VGDDDVSWGFDGIRREKWGDSDSEEWGGEWRAGDVLGLQADLTPDALSLALSVNGCFAPPNGVAFEGIAVSGWLSPALSAQLGVFRVNFGQRPFKHSRAAEGFISVHDFAAGQSPGDKGVVGEGQS
jgi:hypothetical protein